MDESEAHSWTIHQTGHLLIISFSEFGKVSVPYEYNQDIKRFIFNNGGGKDGIKNQGTYS